MREISMQNLDKYRPLNQDDWKRTQVRMPQSLYNALQNYAKENELSLNSAMLALCEKGLEQAGLDVTSNTIDWVQMRNDVTEILESIKTLKEKPTA